MLGGSRSRVAKLGENLGNFISILFFLSFSFSICSSRTNSLVRFNLFDQIILSHSQCVHCAFHFSHDF